MGDQINGHVAGEYFDVFTLAHLVDKGAVYGFACGIGNVKIEGVDTVKLKEHLWNAHKIFVVPIMHKEFQGLRVSPSVYSSLDEIDRFCDAMEDVLKNGLPS